MKDVIQSKLEKYNVTSGSEELNALKEITQNVVLYGLYKAGFFAHACFFGETSLRILHGLDRFSEDLDFSLTRQDTNFKLDNYLEQAMSHMNAFGHELSIDKNDLDDKSVQSRFLKDDSIKNVLTFKYAQDNRVKIKIKIEVDTNPPAGAQKEVAYVDFPLGFPVQIYDLSTLMSGKLHALLCRSYVKGRDWYDFLWYVANNVTPNYLQLQNALYQTGPWQEKNITVNKDFLKTELTKKIESLDWRVVSSDVQKFLNPLQAESLELWSVDFFVARLSRVNF